MVEPASTAAAAAASGLRQGQGHAPATSWGVGRGCSIEREGARRNSKRDRERRRDTGAMRFDSF
jgi:hypothetical protein